MAPPSSAPSMCVTELFLSRISKATISDAEHQRRRAMLASGPPMQRLQLVGGIADGRDEQDTREHEPGHDVPPGEPTARYEWVNLRTAGAENQAISCVERLPDRRGRPPARSRRQPDAGIRRIDVGGRHDDAREPHLDRLADAQRRLRNAANLAAQADFAEDRGRRRQAAVADARRHRGDHAQVRGGLLDRSCRRRC